MFQKGISTTVTRFADNCGQEIKAMMPGARSHRELIGHACTYAVQGQSQNVDARTHYATTNSEIAAYVKDQGGKNLNPMCLEYIY